MGIADVTVVTTPVLRIIYILNTDMTKHKSRNKASNCISLCGKALDWFGLFVIVVGRSLLSSIGNNNNQILYLNNTKL